MPSIDIAPGIVVPAAAIEVSHARSSGPGGQNVNKVASKVDVRVDLARIVGLTPGARARLAALTATRVDGEGRLQVISQRTRDQARNLADALDKVRELVTRALVAPKTRRPSRPTRGSVERRLEGKRRQADRKATRRDTD